MSILYRTDQKQKYYPLDSVLSLLRLGHKYQFDYFRNIATMQLKDTFPTTLDEWDTWMQENDDGSCFEFELVNTAMEAGLCSILPALFFMCIKEYTLVSIWVSCRNLVRARKDLNVVIIR